MILYRKLWIVFLDKLSGTKSPMNIGIGGIIEQYWKKEFADEREMFVSILFAE
jgi:hypothetical protein